MTALTGILAGINLCLYDKSVRSLAMRPWLIGLMSYIFLLVISFTLFYEMLLGYLIGSAASGFFAKVLYYFASGFVGLVLFVVVSVVNLVVVMILSGKYQTDIVILRLKEQGVAIGEGSGITALAKEIGRTVWVEGVKYLWLIPAMLVVVVLGFIPIFTIPAIIMASWLIGFEGFDVVLDVPRVKPYRRFWFAVKNSFSTVLFGFPFVVVAAIPFVGILLPPILAAGASEYLLKSGKLERLL